MIRLALPLFLLLTAPLFLLTACGNTPMDTANARGTGYTGMLPFSQGELIDKAPAALESAGLKVISMDRREGTILAQRQSDLGKDLIENVAIFLTPQDAHSTGIEIVRRGHIYSPVFREKVDNIVGHHLESRIFMAFSR
jgi:hypothetical protein